MSTFINWYGVNRTPNTFIGNVAGVVPNLSTLATKLSILASDIGYFSISGNNIEAAVNKNYTVNLVNYSNNAWFDATTYWIDSVGRKTGNIGADGFMHLANVKVGFFPRATQVIGSQSFRFSTIEGTLSLPSVTTVVHGTNFSNMPNIKRIHIPICTQIATGNLNTIPLIEKVYCDPFLLTSNGGGLNASLLTAQNQGATIVGVLNFTAPNEITDLSHSAGTLNFTPPSSTNVLDFYEVYVDRGNILEKYLPYSEITASGVTVSGLLSGDKVYLYACDIYYNRSKSNEIII